MRVFAISDLHIDFSENLKWLMELSEWDYRNDVLIIAGDIASSDKLIKRCFKKISEVFGHTLYVPGNHDLWINGNNCSDSFERFDMIKKMANDNGILMECSQFGFLSIVPLFGWYDYSFGQPSDELLNIWADFFACKWPDEFNLKNVTEYFIEMNEGVLNHTNDVIITFSHFLPREDLMPTFIPTQKQKLYPVFGSKLLEAQIRILNSDIHIYGHSHYNQKKRLEKTQYINNAFGYPYEANITSKQLQCIFEQ